jgi:hypothetical protein
MKAAVQPHIKSVNYRCAWMILKFGVIPETSLSRHRRSFRATTPSPTTPIARRFSRSCSLHRVYSSLPILAFTPHSCSSVLFICIAPTHRSYASILVINHYTQRSHSSLMFVTLTYRSPSSLVLTHSTRNVCPPTAAYTCRLILCTDICG